MIIKNRTEIHRLIDSLPETVIAQVIRFLEFMLFKLQQSSQSVSLTPQTTPKTELKLQTFAWSNWPPETTFSREELYDDNGR